MKKHKLLAIFMALAMALMLIPTVALADVEDVEDPLADPYVSSLADLKTKLAAAGNKAGDTTIYIKENIELNESDTWTPIPVKGYTGTGVVTIEGGNHTIKGLPDALFAGGFAGHSGIVIKNLTLDAVKISDTTEWQGLGAFIKCIDSMPKIELTNCHLKNSTIVSTGGARVGGLIGWTAGYNNQNDGPVDTYVTITNCSVEKCNITAAGSVGGIIGHAGNNPATYHTITDCTVTNCELNSTDDGGWRVGVVVGTANVGEVTISNITESGNTLTQTDKTAPEHSNLYGRFVPDGTGKLTIDNKPVFTSDTVAAIGSVGYPTLSAAITAAQSGDTVTLRQNVTEDVTIPAGTTLTLDLNGKTLTNASSHTITNNGTLTITDTSPEESGKVVNGSASKSALQNEPGATAIIKGGTLEKNLNVDSKDYYVITNHGAKVTIDGGKIISASTHSSAIENGWYTPAQNSGKE